MADPIVIEQPFEGSGIGGVEYNGQVVKKLIINGNVVYEYVEPPALTWADSNETEFNNAPSNRSTNNLGGDGSTCRTSSEIKMLLTSANSYADGHVMKVLHYRIEDEAPVQCSSYYYKAVEDV